MKLLKTILKGTTDWWNGQRRATDLEVLWPQCKANTPDLYYARVVFATHAFNDDAWLTLGDEEIIRLISLLD